MTTDAISVRTHVGRDLLQSAALFKAAKLVVWEYVSNGLQYKELGLPSVVRVTLDARRKQIVIDDNGRGMDREGLRNFFVMHGENLDRKLGRPGRGRFGTGKAAAFGIADNLRVSSIRDGKRNTVELCRQDIEAAGGDEIPVRTSEHNIRTQEPNGTIVTRSNIRVKNLDQRGVISFIERHLAHWPDKPLVVVNNHPCEYAEPPVARTVRLRPTGPQLEILGNIELTLKVAMTPLETELQGVAIHTNGVWLETALAGAEGQPMSQYIFGHIDVPALDDDSSPIPAFDMSRSMELNRNNEVVQAVLAFVGYEIDRLRRELVKEDQARRSQEDTKKLDREARLIAEMINRDFQDFSARLARVKARSGTGHDLGCSTGEGGNNEDEQLVPGGTIDASEDQPIGSPGRGNGHGGNGGNIPSLSAILKRDENGEPIGKPIGDEGPSRRPRGGFSVKFKEMGEDSPRASYVSAERTIYVNLDHPQIRAAKGSASVNDPVFRRLAYEVAFAEYAIALATEMDRNGEFIEPSDALVEIRETLNRMARQAAALYMS